MSIFAPRLGASDVLLASNPVASGSERSLTRPNVRSRENEERFYATKLSRLRSNPGDRDAARSRRMAIPLLILFTESLDVRFAVGIEELLAGLAATPL